MHAYLVGAAMLAMTAMATMGAAAVITGWVPPWLRRRVLRPKLWGYGAILGSAGMSAYMFLGPFRGPDIEMTPYAMTGMAVFFTGLVLQMMGQRPGRM